MDCKIQDNPPAKHQRPSINSIGTSQGYEALPDQDLAGSRNPQRITQF